VRLAYLVPVYYLTDMDSWVAALMFTVPAYAAGPCCACATRPPSELALRAEELRERTELFAEIALRHERARIASELHDIVGHAISVMVIQAAAGQRLVEADPARARRRSPRSRSPRGRAAGPRAARRSSSAAAAATGRRTDLSLVDEVVTRAAAAA
jgi:signal transduction histidine kinase